MTEHRPLPWTRESRTKNTRRTVAAARRVILDSRLPGSVSLISKTAGCGNAIPTGQNISGFLIAPRLADTGIRGDHFASTTCRTFDNVRFQRRRHSRMRKQLEPRTRDATPAAKTTIPRRTRRHYQFGSLSRAIDDKARVILIAARRGARVTQTQLARRLRRSVSHVRRIERGDARMHRKDFIAFARALGADPYPLFARAIGALRRQAGASSATPSKQPAARVG